MRKQRLLLLAAAIAAIMPLHPGYAQQGQWASPGDPTAKYILDMERKWAESICAANGVVESLVADDFQGTSTSGERYTKADELKDEKGPHIAHDCGLDETKVRFFGENLAIVYGSEHAIGKDKSQAGAKICQIWTDTWLKRGGTWQVVASQDNRVSCP